jgi:hypothetical protein
VNDGLSILSARMRALDRSRAAAPIMTSAPASPPPAESSILNLREAAKIVGIHHRTLRKWPLPWIVVGRIVRVRRSDFESFLQQHAGGVAEAEVNDAH